MSIARAQRHVLEALSAGDTVLLSLHLDVPSRPAWADGVDQHGRSVLLVGGHALRSTPEGPSALAAVLAALGEGFVPEGVHVVTYAPRASAAIAEILDGTADEFLLDGPRESGKTQAVPGALAVLAEQHVRAGFPLPLRAMWIHDTLASAAMKTGRSLEEPLWGGCWRLSQDRTVATLAVGGLDYVTADFVGALDDVASERLRAGCHVVCAEELVPSLGDSGGIPERRYELALTSRRLPTRRRVALSTTNPGSPETWPYQRWIEGGGRPQCRRVQIPGTDRLTPERIAELRASFRDSPDLERRLALGEWVGAKTGELVSEGLYDPAVHVAPSPLKPSPDHILGLGWDGGHSPSCVIGQLINGQVRVYASLNDLHVGVLELIEDQVVPWLIVHAPWARQRSAALVHCIDPSMATAGQDTIRQSAERVIRETLGGRAIKGAVQWPPRREAILRVLRRGHEQGRIPLAISPTPETRLLREALGVTVDLRAATGRAGGPEQAEKTVEPVGGRG